MGEGCKRSTARQYDPLRATHRLRKTHHPPRSTPLRVPNHGRSAAPNRAARDPPARVVARHHSRRIPRSQATDDPPRRVEQANDPPTTRAFTHRNIVTVIHRSTAAITVTTEACLAQTGCASAVSRIGGGALRARSLARTRVVGGVTSVAGKPSEGNIRATRSPPAPHGEPVKGSESAVGEGACRCDEPRIRPSERPRGRRW